jgi:hypothetical protein
MYPAYYIAKHKCKGKPKLVKDFPCHLCDIICSYKSNLFRHYKKAHLIDREEIPLASVRIKRESRPLRPCPVCTKPVTQLCRHDCPGPKPGPSQPSKAPKAVASLERPTRAPKAVASLERPKRVTRSTAKAVDLDDEASATSDSETTRAPKAVASVERPSRAPKAVASLERPSRAPEAVASLERPKRVTRSTAKAVDLDDEASATSDSETSVSSYKPSRSPTPIRNKKSKPCPKSKKIPPNRTPSHSSTNSDEESDADSDASRDSLVNPRKAVKGKGLSRKGKRGKALPLPPRKGTWRTASDVPDDICKAIKAAYAHVQFSSLQDHQVRRWLDKIKKIHWIDLMANSVGRCVVDAINLIKLVYDSQRSRPIHKSPFREQAAAE